MLAGEIKFARLVYWVLNWITCCFVITNKWSIHFTVKGETHPANRQARCHFSQSFFFPVWSRQSLPARPLAWDTEGRSSTETNAGSRNEKAEMTAALLEVTHIRKYQWNEIFSVFGKGKNILLCTFHVGWNSRQRLRTGSHVYKNTFYTHQTVWWHLLIDKNLRMTEKQNLDTTPKIKTPRLHWAEKKIRLKKKKKEYLTHSVMQQEMSRISFSWRCIS